MIVINTQIEVPYAVVELLADIGVGRRCKGAGVVQYRVLHPIQGIDHRADARNDVERGRHLLDDVH